MKKVLTIMLGLAVVFFLGFSAGASAEEYVGFSQADEHGYVMAEVQIENGEILSVSLTEFNDLGQAKGEDYPWDEFHEAMEVLPERFVEANSADVDGISGATNTAEKAMEAVQMALDKSEGVETFDGTFLGVSEPSERGNVGVAWVTVEGDEIVDVRLEEADDEGEFKDEDYPWAEFHFAQDLVADAFVLFDSPDVDTYTGATSSSELWIEAVRNALEKAGW